VYFHNSRHLFVGRDIIVAGISSGSGAEKQLTSTGFIMYGTSSFILTGFIADGNCPYNRCYIMPLIDKKIVAFTECYTEYFQVVYGTIYSKTSGADDAEDLVQEVFMHFYAKMDGIENRRSWLYSAINNVLANYFRKKKKFASEEDIADYLSDVSLTFVNGFRDTRIIIDEAVRQLPETYRIMFDLIAVQNLTYELAARHLSLTRRQVEYQYSLILQDIRKFLNARGISKIEDLL
jgi:RNA polymerase sigma-70 factor, ECF subfamily